MNQKDLLNRTKSFVGKHAGKVVIATTAVTATASAMDAGSIANGTALLSAGINVAQTEPLGSIISMIAVIVGALAFIKIIRRFY
jgi:hypothetical protein